MTVASLGWTESLIFSLQCVIISSLGGKIRLRCVYRSLTCGWDELHACLHPTMVHSMVHTTNVRTTMVHLTMVHTTMVHSLVHTTMVHSVVHTTMVLTLYGTQNYGTHNYGTPNYGTHNYGTFCFHRNWYTKDKHNLEHIILICTQLLVHCCAPHLYWV